MGISQTDQWNYNLILPGLNLDNFCDGVGVSCLETFSQSFCLYLEGRVLKHIYSSYCKHVVAEHTLNEQDKKPPAS